MGKFFLLFALLVSTTMAWAQDDNGYTWDSETRTLTITSAAGISYSFEDHPDCAIFIVNDGVSTTIPDGALDNNAFLTTVTLGNGVTSIGVRAFENCDNLTNVTLGTGVRSIGEEAFNGCEKLASITIKAPSLTSYVSSVFSNCGNFNAIYVPAGSIDEYATGWTDYASLLKATWTGNQIFSGDFAGYWATYYNSGCAVTVDENTDIYYISAVNGTSATLTENTKDKVITAGQAVLLKSTASTVTMSFSGATSDHDYTGNQLVGVDAQTTISGSAYNGKYIYTLANEGSKLGFYQYYSPSYTTNTTLAANKAFLALTAAASARGFVFQLEETTGVNEEFLDEPSGKAERRMKNEEFAPAVYYNLNGQKVEKPAKGLYIRNGKKVVITKISQTLPK